jgi:D-serine deaminase-like pyridoxal phosphate-dependent protein
MASYFADDGWRDITIAFPVNLRERRRISALASRVQLNLVAENLESLEALEAELQSPVRIFIKTDTGAHRTGLGPEQTELIDRLVERLTHSRRLSFAGFLSHAGHTYRARGREAIRAVHLEALGIMRQLRERYAGAHPDLTISIGDTPACSTVDEYGGIDEIRPGNFVFYDLMQLEIGSCRADQIAVALACPVVALHPERQEIVLYGGGVHLSKDRSYLPDGREYYGRVAAWDGNGWTLPDPSAYLRGLSQEHGIVKATPALMQRTRVGDLLPILPVHSCMTADLMKGYLTTKGKRIEMLR